MRVALSVAALAAALSNIPPHAADAVPKFDIAKNCKAEIADTGGIGETLASCMNDEEQVRKQLTEHWSDYARQDRLACVAETTSDGTPSYVELVTCVEIATDNRSRSKDRS